MLRKAVDIFLPSVVNKLQDSMLLCFDKQKLHLKRSKYYKFPRVMQFLLVYVPFPLHS